MQQIDEYMTLSREERRAHLNLDMSCDVRGGTSKEFRGLLAHFLGTSVPSGRWIQLCHACHNRECSNPNHLYWGSPKDNHMDQIENGTFACIASRTISKYGADAAEVFGRGGRKNKGRDSTLKLSARDVSNRHDIIRKYDRAARGWLGKCAVEIGISHSQLGRFLKLHPM